MPTKQPEAKVRKSKNPITGILNITGEPDSGKTWFALSSGAEPERTAFIDDDVKGQAIYDQVRAEGRDFGFYINLVQKCRGMRELDFHNFCVKNILDVLEPGKLDVLVWDTWTRFENTFHPVVVSSPNKFRQFYSSMGTIKGAEQWGAAFEYEAALLSMLTEIAPLVILTSHLKKDASKRDVAESKKPLVQKSRMRVYLRHSPDTPKPTGLMLKRLSKVELSKGMKPINVTHRKVYPFTWETLLYFWNNPVDNAAPGDGEQLNEFELSILDGILTKDQKDVLAMARIDAEREREEELQQRKTIKKMSGGKNGNIPSTPAALLTQAMKKYEMDGEQVAEALGLEGFDAVMELNEEEVQKAWERLER